MYKYNLLKRLDSLNMNDREVFWLWAPEQLFRNKETIRGWLYIKEDSKEEISYINLKKLSVFFGCKVSELFTTQKDYSAAIYKSIQKHRDHVYNRN